MKIRNKKLAVGLMSFALVSACGVGFAMTSNTLNASAETNPVAFQAGASVRVAGRVVDGVEQVTPAIRFSLIIDESIVESIGTTTEIGMIIVPETYITAYNDYVKAFVATEEQTAAKDYYDYFTTESKCISFVYDSQDYLATVDADGKLVDPATTTEYTYVVRGAVDQVSMLTREYVAIGYTANLDGTNKVYAEETSLARSVAYVSAAAINAGETAAVLPVNVQKAAYEILGTEYNAEVNPFTDTAFDLAKSEVTLKKNATVELASKNLNEFSVKYTSDNECVTVDASGKVTAVKAGTATITAKIGEVYTRTCEVTVSEPMITVNKDTYSFEFVKDGDKTLNRKGEAVTMNGLAQELDISITQDGEEYTGEVTYTSNKTSVVTVENGVLTPVGDGTATITIAADGVEKTVNVTVDVYTAIDTQAEMEAIPLSTYAKYMLMADIDVKGGYFKSIGGSNYANNEGIGFKGIFDGNGHAVMNYTPSNNGTVANNTGLFAVLRNNSIIRNLNCINATVASRSAALVAHSFGTIENCFVDATINYYEQSSNNPTAAVVTKLNSQASVYNTIAVVRVAGEKVEGKDFTKEHSIAAMIGRSYSGAIIENCYSVSPSGLHFYQNYSGFDAGTETNYGDFDTLEAFYANVNAFSGWTFESGYYPCYGTLNATVEAVEEASVTKNSTYELDVTANLPVVYALADEYAGVTLNANDIVTLSADVETTEIVINVTSLYSSQINKQITLTVIEDSYEFAMEKTAYEFKWLTTDTTDPTEMLSYTLLKNGVEDEAELTFVSSNENVAKVVDGALTGTGNGTATITISLGDLELKEITVKCTEFIPIYTTADFDNIDNNKSANYILMNDLDFANYTNSIVGTDKDKYNGSDYSAEERKHWFLAFSSYNTAVGATTTAQFTGIFDGNGYALKNITPGNDRHYSKKDYNFSIFGVVGATGVVRNLAVYANVIHRSSVISNYMLGTVENCYVEANIIKSGAKDAFVESAKNGLGLIAQEARTGSVVSNCVTKLTFAEGNTNYTYVAGIAAVNYSTMTNCSVIVDNATLGASIGIYNTHYNPGTVDTNTAVYASESKLATEGKVTYDTAIWLITESKVTLLDGCTIYRAPVTQE